MWLHLDGLYKFIPSTWTEISHQSYKLHVAIHTLPLTSFDYLCCVFSDSTGSPIICLCISVYDNLHIFYLPLHIKVVISHVLDCFILLLCIEAVKLLSCTLYFCLCLNCSISYYEVCLLNLILNCVLYMLHIQYNSGNA
jgi:hypothetical protein